MSLYSLHTFLRVSLYTAIYPQGYLFDTSTIAGVSAIFHRELSEKIPLKRVAHDSNISYRSAIALQLAAQQIPPAAQSPQQLAQALTTLWQQLTPAILPLPPWQSTLLPWVHLTADSRGWLQFDLSEKGYFHWLITGLTQPIEPQSSAPKAVPNAVPAAQSGPFSWHHAYARCGSMLHQAQQRGWIQGFATATGWQWQAPDLGLVNSLAHSLADFQVNGLSQFDRSTWDLFTALIDAIDDWNLHPEKRPSTDRFTDCLADRFQSNLRSQPLFAFAAADPIPLTILLRLATIALTQQYFALRLQALGDRLIPSL